ncbi:hypothetical protein [Sulfuricella sp.]|uniref:outer membrane lipoprotein n=1 Tax=Sulfuricella sp. TaxID=2099377 RepID=UPI002BB287D5|nr:hypothetical protein [Sulfuricella sp.]HUX64334.1 hypothetical protein [Sulfuricella sp.]
MKKLLVLTAASIVLLPGCANVPGSTAGLGSGDFSRAQARQVMSVQFGTVQAVRAVQIEGGQSGAGMAAGAVVGGLLASHVGTGRGQTVAGLLGAVGGGIAGAAGEKAMTRTAGVEITVKLENGQALAVTQAVEQGEVFKTGDRVRVLTGGNTVRVAL